MSRRFIVAMLSLGLALILMPQISLAVDDHLSQTIEYTKLAIDDGEYGRADGLAAHVEAALTHAEVIAHAPQALVKRRLGSAGL
jgi:hypothetical protein